MDLGLTESQEKLKENVRSLLDRECSLDVVRVVERDRIGCPPELWEQVVRQGWLGVALPIEYGGSGGDFVDLSILLEEMGWALFPGPFFSTTVLGALPILSFGTSLQKEKYLPKIARGEAIFTCAMVEPWQRFGASSLHTRAQPMVSGYGLTGEKVFVPNAESADYLLVPAALEDESDNVTVFVVSAHSEGVQLFRTRGLAPEHRGWILLEDVEVGSDDILGEPGSGWPIVQQIERWGAAGLCAQIAGAAQRLLEMTVEYAKERVQFGRPIGSFQAIQHHCANMAIDVDSMRYMAYLAAWKLATQDPADEEVSMTKAWCSKAGDRVASLAHQVHGGISVLEDHPVAQFSRRMKVWALAFGGAADHEEVVSHHLGL